MEITKIGLILIWSFFVLKHFLFDRKIKADKDYVLIFRYSNIDFYLLRSFFFKDNIFIFFILYLVIFLELGIYFTLVGIFIELIVKTKVILKQQREKF
jgi:hypothetical protein